ncbi:PEP-CTERM sorting domain-containing protein (plasmid) [Verrucomicrobiaceae bacterium 227]
MKLKPTSPPCLAAALLVAGILPSQAIITLVDPTTNDGSFESQYTGGNITDETTTTNSAGDWVLVTSGFKAGILGRPNTGAPTSAFDNIAASHQSFTGGGISLFTDNPGGGSTITATFANLLGTNGYDSLNIGDVISYSVDINALGAIGGQNNTTSNVTLSLDFGNGLVGGANLIADGVDGSTAGATPYANTAHETLSLMHTVTATDVAGGVLQVVATLNTPDAGSGGGNAYIDNIVVSVEPIPEPSSIALLGFGLLGLLRRRR